MWIKTEDIKPPLDKLILVSDGEYVTICELSKTSIFGGGEYIRMCPSGFGGHEWEFDFDYEQIILWMEVIPLPNIREIE